MKKLLIITAAILSSCHETKSAKNQQAIAINDSLISVFWQKDEALKAKDLNKRNILTIYEDSLDSELEKIYPDLPDSLQQELINNYWKETTVKERLEKQSEKLR